MRRTGYSADRLVRWWADHDAPPSKIFRCKENAAGISAQLKNEHQSQRFHLTNLWIIMINVFIRFTERPFHASDELWLSLRETLWIPSPS